MDHTTVKHNIKPTTVREDTYYDFICHPDFIEENRSEIIVLTFKTNKSVQIKSKIYRNTYSKTFANRMSSPMPNTIAEERAAEVLRKIAGNKDFHDIQLVAELDGKK